jgi:hypothetical protein
VAIGEEANRQLSRYGFGYEASYVSHEQMLEDFRALLIEEAEAEDEVPAS